MEESVDRQESDTHLMRRIQERDETAVALLYDRYGGLLYTILLRMLNDATASEEILQDVFLSVWHQAQTWNENRGSVQAWLVAITRHRAIDALRKRREPTTPLEHDAISPDTTPDEVAIKSAISAEVRMSVESLPPKYREVLEAIYFSGLTQKEAAHALGIPYGTVKSRLRLAFERMARSLRVRGLIK